MLGKCGSRYWAIGVTPHILTGYAHVMNPLDFYAMRTGAATQPDGGPATLRVAELGRLRVASGMLEASDPFVTLGDGPVFDIEPGSYEVFVTIADVSEKQDGSHEREAYLSLLLNDGVVSSVEAAASVRGIPEPGEYWGVGVDAGTVAFADHEAIGECMPTESDENNWYDDVFENGTETSWFSLMDSDEPYEAGMANIVLPLAQSGENVVLSHSGWGDGFYPVVVTKDSEGRLLGIHIDLLVVGEVDPELIAELDPAELDPAEKTMLASEGVEASSGNGFTGSDVTAGPAANPVDGAPGSDLNLVGSAGVFTEFASGGPEPEAATQYGQLPGSNPPVEDVRAKKPGFFARLFGRRKK